MIKKHFSQKKGSLIDTKELNLKHYSHKLSKNLKIKLKKTLLLRYNNSCRSSETVKFRYI